MWNKWTQSIVSIKTKRTILTGCIIQDSCIIWTHNLNYTIIMYIFSPEFTIWIENPYDKYAYTDQGIFQMCTSLGGKIYSESSHISAFVLIKIQFSLFLDMLCITYNVFPTLLKEISFKIVAWSLRKAGKFIGLERLCIKRIWKW